ncbi:hypothetical protein GALL_544220 [mine drainage metagenome]|uniref:Uncharacterized protein n=1 Tax=mine drainage metagenome TaxID=410659 RepID=A0A1J5NYZ7_9ZZZZ
MRHLDAAGDQVVAHCGPRGLLARGDLDAILLVETQHRRHHDRGAVGEGDEADLHVFHFGLAETESCRARLGLQPGQQAGDCNCSPGLDDGAARGLLRSSGTGCDVLSSAHGRSCEVKSEKCGRKKSLRALQARWSTRRRHCRTGQRRYLRTSGFCIGRRWPTAALNMQAACQVGSWRSSEGRRPAQASTGRAVLVRCTLQVRSRRADARQRCAP